MTLCGIRLHQAGLVLLLGLIKVCVSVAGWRLTGVKVGWLVGLAGTGGVHTAGFLALWSLSSLCSL